MATPAELRAKLLAQRAAQQDEVRRRDEIHQQAKLATRSMVTLGYNFYDILELVKTEVSEEHLNSLFKAIGIYRKRRLPREDAKPTPFGASRWLDRHDDLVIDFDDDFITSSESEEDLSDANHEEIDGESSVIAEEMHKASSIGNPFYSTQSTSFDIITEDPHGENIAATASGELPKPLSASIGEKHEEDGHTTVVPFDNGHVTENGSSLATMESVPEQYSTSPGQPETHDMEDDLQASDISDNAGHDALVVEDPQDVEMMDMPTERVTESEESGSHHSDRNIPEQSHISNETNVDTEGEIDGDNMETTDNVPDQESGIDQQNGEEHLSDQENLPGDPVLDEQAVQKELEKVKAQILEVQQKKLERETQKEAQIEMARRNMELRDIASKRALLMQKRQQLDISKSTHRVSILEKKLAEAKKRLTDTSNQLKYIDEETAELEKQELKLREELSRPRPISTADTHSESHEVQPETEKLREHAYQVPKKPEPKHKFLTSAGSPLRMFSSFRMCPSLGPSQWFSRSFNSHFIRDMESRTMCPNELQRKKGKCADVNCDHIHFSEFDIPPLKICEYMATRQLERPGFREELMVAIETHLSGPEIAADQLAATIIGFCRKYDSSQILDWQSWEAERPL